MMDVELTKDEYARIRSELDMRPFVTPTLGILLLDALLLIGITSLLRSGSGAAFMLAQLLLVVVFFNSFSILHECGHGSASGHRWLNTLLGHYASTFCFIPYFPWKYIHQKHHAWTGNLERDPVLKSLRAWRSHGVPRIVRWSWRSWIPLGALLQHVVYATYPQVMWRAGEATREKLVRNIVSLLWIPTAWTLLHAWLPDVVSFSNLAPAFVLFLVAEELVNIPHHVDMSTFDSKLPIWQQYRATRSCYYPRGVSELLVLNFNFHIEHHLFPALPWYRLRRAREIVRAALGERYQQAIGIAWNIEHRTRDLQSIVDRYDGDGQLVASVEKVPAEPAS
jgi:fatty acid desaturase